VKEKVDANSKAEGFTTSRLPKFTSEEVNFIKGNIRFTAKNIIFSAITHFVCRQQTHKYDANFKLYCVYFMLAVG